MLVPEIAICGSRQGRRGAQRNDLRLEGLEGRAGFCPLQLNETNYFDIREKMFLVPKTF